MDDWESDHAAQPLKLTKKAVSSITNTATITKQQFQLS